MQTLDFVMILEKDFKLGMSLKVLLCALVRPVLGYGCIVWDPYATGDLYIRLITA